ncbi:hypothetical protein LWI28_011292 [Acer negundo]|uniref:Uncharacterized protein n=1 Tax=Acer negundo TaxID=4023 RepID=A0AAD5NWH5_ACENE|nr:hypothetical protein LWI28_011292 [Acer negundo]
MLCFSSKNQSTSMAASTVSHSFFPRLLLSAQLSQLLRHIAKLQSSEPTITLSHYFSKMKKGAHPQMQWISYVTQSGRLMNVMMTKIHHVGKVYHFRARRQMAESIGQLAKFKRRYEQQQPENAENNDK